MSPPGGFSKLGLDRYEPPDRVSILKYGIIFALVGVVFPCVILRQGNVIVSAEIHVRKLHL